MFAARNSVAAPSAANYIEDMFSTYLYTGNGGSQTITNGIDLAGKGGLVWIKSRGLSGNNTLIDSVRGISKFLYTNDTSAQVNDPGTITSFNSNGFTQNNSYGDLNSSGRTYVSWTFREQPKFFDVVTYTGDGVAGLTVPHNLGSEPGCIIVKNITDGSADWAVYHRSIGNTGGLTLNNTNAITTGSAYWNNTSPTSTQFTLGSFTRTNAPGNTFVAYLFAHNAGGFGLTGTDNVVSCGTFTTDGTGAAGNITLGYEAQWVLIKRSDGAGGWNIIDTMRGSSLTSYNYLSPNTSGVESSSTSAGQGIFPTATGFFVGTNFPAASANYIYIAIRRGPMKVPTLGTSVFSPLTRTGTGTTAIATYGFATDLVIPVNRPHDATGATPFFDKLRGVNQAIYSNSTVAEENRADTFVFSNTGVTFGTNSIGNSSGASYVNWAFQRAPGFFDEVCYTGTGSAQNVTHNLTVAPELVIIKNRNVGGAAYGWVTGSSYYPSWGRYIQLNTSDAVNGGNNAGPFNNTAPTSSVFTVNTWTETNGSGSTYVAYLFATCPGVSKVGSYTGTGALQTVACGFTSGARFVLVKRVDSTGDWYVWDSARGITSGNDPYLLLNSTAAEVTSTNYVDTDTTGFKVTAAAPAALNAVGGTYIFLAVA